MVPESEESPKILQTQSHEIKRGWFSVFGQRIRNMGDVQGHGVRAKTERGTETQRRHPYRRSSTYY